MDRLVLERTQPVQGKPVDVSMSWNGEPIGLMTFEFKSWLKFKKLLEKGLEMDAREDHALDLKMTVKGMEVVAKGEPYPNKPKTTLLKETDLMMQQPSTAEIVALDDEDAADLAAIAAAEAGKLPPTLSVEESYAQIEDKVFGPGTGKVTQGLIRSLRRDNADD